jgi:hypothetical protein
MKKLKSSGFARKDNKAFQPDPKTGKWRGGKTKNGHFATIKPGWNANVELNGKDYKLELWAFDTPWGQQSMFFKLFEVTEDKEDKEVWD